MSQKSQESYELYDRALQRDMGRFSTETEALAFIETRVDRTRVGYLTLGVERPDGEYSIVVDGFDLHDRLARRRQSAEPSARNRFRLE